MTLNKNNKASEIFHIKRTPLSVPPSTAQTIHLKKKEEPLPLQTPREEEQPPKDQLLEQDILAVSAKPIYYQPQTKSTTPAPAPSYPIFSSPNNNYAENPNTARNEHKAQDHRRSSVQANSYASMSEEEKRIKRLDENLDLMGEIIQKSELYEQQLKKQGVETAFFNVNKEKSMAKRKAEREEMNALLKKIEQRTFAATTLDQVKKKPPSPLRGTSMKNKWLDESKARARNNFLGYVQAQKIEDITIQAQIQQEKMAHEHKSVIANLTNEKEELIKENKSLQSRITKQEEELSAVKYTLELLRSKLEKTTAREIENQQKLKLFAEYEPLFEELRQNFNFENPHQVIKRMEMLERAQTESYSQLLLAQEQKNQMERLVEKTKQEQELRVREKTTRALEEKQRAEQQNQKLQERVAILEAALKKSESYQDKYLTLNRAVTDLYDSWMKDIEKLGYREALEFDKPDVTNTKQLIAAIKNILIAFSPSNAGEHYLEFAKLANRYWLRYFKDVPEIKSKPKKIFNRLSELLDKKNEMIATLEKQVNHIHSDKKYLQIEMEKVVREKNAFETELNSKKPVHLNNWSQKPASARSYRSQRMNSSALSAASSTQEVVERKRPRSAPARKIQQRPSSASSVRTNRSQKTTMPLNTGTLSMADLESSPKKSASFFLTELAGK